MYQGWADFNRLQAIFELEWRPAWSELQVFLAFATGFEASSLHAGKDWWKHLQALLPGCSVCFNSKTQKCTNGKKLSPAVQEVAKFYLQESRSRGFSLKDAGHFAQSSSKKRKLKREPIHFEDNAKGGIRQTCCASRNFLKRGKPAASSKPAEAVSGS